MGAMHFLVPRRDRVGADAARRAYFAGIDEVPWISRVHWNDQGLVLERDEFESGNFYVPYVVEGRGELMLSTASLMERAGPYNLHVELARGTLNRLRNQLGAATAADPEVARHLHVAHEELARAVTLRANPAEAVDAADRSLAASLAGIDAVCQGFANQALAARRDAGRLSTLLGANLGTYRPAEPIAGRLADALNTIQVPLAWRDIEASEGKRDFSLSDAQIDWARTAGFKVCGGPLLSIDKWSLPDWLYLFGEDDVESFRSCVSEHIQSVVARYRGRVHLWVCSAGLNVENDFLRSEEDRLRMAVLTIDSIRRQDPRAPIVISIDQPWGAFMSRQELDLSPLHFADALVRAELGLAGVGLEINVGYAPGGSEPRDPLAFAHQMDRFSSLGLPLLVSLTLPSAATPDPNAIRKCEVIGYDAGAELTPEAQRNWAEQMLPTLLARQPVQGIVWNQLTDSRPHPLAHGGLFDEHDQEKPLVGYLEQLRREFLA